ncbi:MAG: hypothetical protein K2X81_17230 [Candidatus Obscuribacterales bacterium]|nr:hypothetical protein [Candidatus Obscuribacterales bacterium]
MSEKIVGDDNFKSAMALEKILPSVLEGSSGSMNLLGFVLDGPTNKAQAWNDISKQLTHDLPIAGVQSFSAVTDDKGNLSAIEFTNNNAKLSCKDGNISWDCSWSKNSSFKTK